MKKQYLYAAITIALWSTTATVGKLLLGSLSSMQVLAASCGYAAAFLLLLCLVQGKRKLLKTYKAKDILVMSGMGMLGVFFYNLFWFIGISRISASQAMIINYLWPMMAILAACVILKEKLTFRKTIAALMSFAGVIIVTANGQAAGMGNQMLMGILFCVMAAVSYGLFVALNKRLHYDKTISMFVCYAVGFAVSAICVAISGEGLKMDGMQHLGMAWLGVLTHAIGYVTWALAMDGGETAKIANLAYITPFLSLVWNFLVLGEPLNIRCVLGLIVIVAGIFVQMKDNK